MINWRTTYFKWMEPLFEAPIVEGFLELLENRHLYQNLGVGFPDYGVVLEELNARERELLKGSTQATPGGELDRMQGEWRAIYEAAIKAEWRIARPQLPKSAGFFVHSSEDDEREVHIGFTPGTVMIYCGTCDRVEPYNYQYGKDLLEGWGSPWAESWGYPVRADESTTVQVFALGYQCQACKGVPEFFIVRRYGTRLQLVGRSPMEVVSVPKQLPKKQQRFFSDAIVAYNSGQVLAASFLLRTFIEQYVRHAVSDQQSRDIDSLFNGYAGGLPDDLKQRFPSLQAVYNQLSEDLHAAGGSDEVFLQAMADIEKHFDARRVFEV